MKPWVRQYIKAAELRKDLERKSATAGWRMRKQPMMTAREFVIDPSLREELDIVSRLYQLRKARKIGVVLADSGRYWIAEEESDPWGTKVRYSVAQLKDLVERLEQKKPAGNEQGEWKQELKSA